MLDLDSYGGEDPLGTIPLFKKNFADVLAPKLSHLFKLMVRSGRFLEC